MGSSDAYMTTTRAIARVGDFDVSPARAPTSPDPRNASKIIVLYKNMTTIESLERLSDSDLVATTERLAANARASTAELVAALAVFDTRRLYLGLGYSSLFTYCTLALRLTEGEAFNRIEAARAVRRFPDLLPHLFSGALSLTAVRLLAPHLTPENRDSVVRDAVFKSTREIERLVAHLRPQPPVPSTVRKLPEVQAPPPPVTATNSAPASVPVATGPLPEPASRRPLVKPLSADSYRLQITMSVATHDKLRKAQALMRHRVPSGDPAAIFDRALDALLREVEKERCAAATRPRSGDTREPATRHIPAAVTRAVWTRDESRCAFRAADGRRCDEVNFLELHHVRAYARGGKATVDNIELRCRAHNVFEAEREFGFFVKEDRPGYAARPA